MNWKKLANQKCNTELVTLWKAFSQLTEKQIKWVQTEEDFIRLFYDLDSKHTINANILRFLALYIYSQDITSNIKKFQENLRLISQKHDINEKSSISQIITFMQDLSPQLIKKVSIELQVDKSSIAQPVHVEVQSKQDDFISFDLRQPDEEIDTLETCEFELEKSPNLAQTLRNVLSNTERYKKYANNTKNWLKKGSTQSFGWLKKRKFFQPEITKTSLWTWHQYKKGQDWVFYKQEVYIRIPQKKPYLGYAAILNHKFLKIKFVIDKHKRKSLCTCNPGDFIRVIKGILNSSKLEKSQREILTQLKDSLLIRQKMLLQPETTLDIINYGEKTFHKILLLLSKISNKRKINKQIYQYLLIQIEQVIQNHHHNFRREIEKTAHLQGLKSLLCKYPLKRLTTITKYEELQIIYKIKCIVREYEKTPHQLIQILNLYFGTVGETNIRQILPQILYTNDINLRIINALYGDRYLEDLQKTLSELKKQPQCKNVAQPLEHLIESFLSSKKFTFLEFKTSLNFVPTKLQNKITSLVRRKLQEQLNIQTNNILVQEGRYIKRYEGLLVQLQNVQYQGANLVVYGVSPQDIAQRIKSISYQQKTIDRAIQNTFSELKIPNNLKLLIKKAKSAQQLAKQKDLPNCIRVLQKIQNILQKQEPINLRKVIISLFKQHGSINFSTSTKEITGYNIAYNLSRFFNDHTIKELNIPESIHPTVYEKLHSIMDKSGRMQKL
ncbi:hypothetical protein [Candidatus Uabimicrobium sp. HlEnr_7]|uniref:hypothetical protein n=1 Tax=Candidatus Uabimicrobium helgolandensis TaxID=3095367 RepID=UPI003557AE4C